MLHIFDWLRGVDLLSVAVRLVLAALCGGVIGIEREFRHRPAGFRTHILICLGAAMTTLTGQYLALEAGYVTDVSRLGAQVIAGIGFIGAGTIIVTRRHRVKGLTTAAGLWAAAIVGLALGAGFVEGGLLTTVLILVAELVFGRLERKAFASATEVGLWVRYEGREALEAVLEVLRADRVTVLDLEITRTAEEAPAATAVFSLRLGRTALDRLIAQLAVVPGVAGAEES